MAREFYEFLVTVRVVYEGNGETEETLKDTLDNAVEHLAGEGLLTGETDAEVHGWTYGVVPLMHATTADDYQPNF